MCDLSGPKSYQWCSVPQVSLASIITTISRESSDQDDCLVDYRYAPCCLVASCCLLTNRMSCSSLKWTSFAYFFVSVLVLGACIVGFGVRSDAHFTRDPKAR